MISKRKILVEHLGTFFILLFIINYATSSSHGAIIPPQWANHSINPCAKESWQLLHWPQDQKCYNIFTQGPCGATQELFFDEEIGMASCRCSRGTAWHSKSRTCHVNYSKGPCGPREYFAIEENDNSGNMIRSYGECFKYNDCPPGHLFWPPSKKCFLHLSRGPCLDGSLLYIHPQTGSTECGCTSELMSTNYWEYGGSCHELFTKGPCIEGHIFVYNLTIGATECACGPHLFTNYHEQTERCYELDTVGPCRLGQVFIYNSDTKRAKCSCLPGYINWLPTGTCFRAYTRGPCPAGKFLQPHANKTEVGTCVRNTCVPGELLDPDSKRCYLVGKRGPCSNGKLWVFERATSVRGSCHCDPHLVGYWAAHGVCYELGERGPCPKRKVLFYEKETGLLICRCDIRRDFVSWANGRCIRAGIQRDKLIPVAEPLGMFIRRNTIMLGRVHRGLTLPFPEEVLANVTETNLYPNAQTLQEDILKDVMTNILNNNNTDKTFQQIEVPQAQVETETTIHRVTMSRSVSRKKRRDNEKYLREELLV